MFGLSLRLEQYFWRFARPTGESACESWQITVLDFLALSTLRSVRQKLIRLIISQRNAIRLWHPTILPR
jgi:hypothetical protein